MKSVAKLRSAGFTVTATHPDVAVGCTRVASYNPFHYFKLDFDWTPSEIFEKLKPATSRASGIFELIIAGQYFGDDQELPFHIVNPAEHAEMDLHKRRCDQAEAKMKQCQADFEVFTKGLVAG